MQRNGIYEERKRILQRNNLRCWILEYAERTLYDLIIYINEREDKNAILLTLKIQELFGTPFKFDFILNNENPNQSILFFQQQFQIGYTLKEVEMEAIEPGLIRELERSFLLQQIDNSWKEHLQKISLLRESIRWRAYGQKDPLTEYKKEAYNFFVITMTRIRHRVVYFILRAKLVIE
jgi:preprotein translocase subunit SecA